MEESIKLLKSLADDTRFKIVEHLLEGEKCVCENSKTKVSEHQTTLVKEDKNSEEISIENTINKLRGIVDLLQIKMNFNPV